jgi:hypothetical protein
VVNKREGKEAKKGGGLMMKRKEERATEELLKKSWEEWISRYLMTLWGKHNKHCTIYLSMRKGG